MEHKSIWSISASCQRRPSLQEDIRTEVVIIGAGMAGILTAHLLKQAGVNCVVLEASRIGRGQTQNTTAKVTLQHGLIYDSMLQKQGQEKAEQYVKASQEALQRYHILSEKHANMFDWKECSAYLYATKDEKQLQKEYEAAKRLGIKAELSKQSELPFPVSQTLCYPGQGQLHPLKLLYALAEELDVYEETKVKQVEPNTVITELGTVRADHIVFACHFPFPITPGYFFMRMHQERSYVLAVKAGCALEGMYYGIEHDSLSFRGAGEYTLVGGGAHRTGKKPSGSAYEYLSHCAQTYWPGCKEQARWSAQDCKTLDGIPYIGTFSKSRPNWYVATGFGKWGMTNSMVSAMLLSGLIRGQKMEYEDVFSPQRLSLQSSAGTFVVEGKEAVTGLLRQTVAIPKDSLEEVREGEGKIVEYEGGKYGVYKDEKGTAYIVSTKCPHLGCQLQWNGDEKSWDCPCHGSRFDYQGKRLDEPAQEDIGCKIKRRQ